MNNMTFEPGIAYQEETFVLELVSPLHIGSGEPDGTSDAGVVLDFNGLPGIPGTSLQGMLRAELAAAAGEDAAERIFGRSGVTGDDMGRGGRLWVSWGVIHDSKNNPVRKRISTKARDEDPVLRDAARPMLRDHVRLNERGVAQKNGKFDELVVSAGHRFSVTLRLGTAAGDSCADLSADWRLLQQIYENPALRLGGKTRRGLGSFRMANSQPGESVATEQMYRLTLAPEGLWMFGGGSSDEADSAPVRGNRIKWDGALGSVEDVWVLAGSSIKGAIAHRTRFHANRIAGNYIDKRNEQAAANVEEWLYNLFGHEGGNGKEAKPGKVYIDDILVPSSQVKMAGVQNHVSIDPFTGGAKESALFNDQPLVRDAGSLDLKVRWRGSPPAEALQALQEALKDLCESRLSLGAHSGRGYGVFREVKIAEHETDGSI